MVTDTVSVVVGLGEYHQSTNPKEVLVAYGLGSCIGVGVYDPKLQIAGLLHALLPQANGSAADSPTKYVDSGLRYLVEQVQKRGGDPSRLIIKVVGGANMLTVSDLRSVFNIGDRNIAAMQQTAQALRLKINAQEVGGVLGRTFRVYVATGRMTIRVLGGYEQELV